MKAAIMLICKGVSYFTPDDETIFFDWIKKIKCIENISGVGNVLYLHISSNTVSYYDLKNLIGLFYRYEIDMKQLAQLLTPENKQWFARRSAPWYYRVFGARKSKKT